MRTIAQELGKPYSAFEEYTKTLIDNWVDTKEALIMLDEASIAQLRFPLLLQKKLVDKIAQLKNTNPQSLSSDLKMQGLEEKIIEQGPNNAENLGNYSQNQVQTADRGSPHKVISQQTGGQTSTQRPVASSGGNHEGIDFEDQIEETINVIYRTTLGTDNLLELLSVMHSLLTNIINKPHESKFRQVKLSNPKIASTIGSNQSAIHLFKLLCFFENSEGNLEFIGKDELDLAELKVASQMIHDFAIKIEQHRGNIGAASFSSTAGHTNADVAAKYGGQTSAAMDTLALLKANRSVD